jgi:quercetin dioxygenase-like cupin family protein
MKVWQFVEKIPWQPHPIAEGVLIKPLVSKKNEDTNVTCMLVQIPKGKEVSDHIHGEQDDILFPLKGKATMWVDGIGSFSLEPGVIVRIPKGIKHKIVEIREDLLIYDVFYPALM